MGAKWSISFSQSPKQRKINREHTASLTMACLNGKGGNFKSCHRVTKIVTQSNKNREFRKLNIQGVVPKVSHSSETLDVTSKWL